MKRLAIALIFLMLIAVIMQASAEEIKISTIVPDQQIVRGKDAAIGNSYRERTDADVDDGNIAIEGNAYVNGTLKVGTVSAPEGTIRYDGTSRKFQYHNGYDWVPLGGGWTHKGDTVFQGRHPIGGFSANNYVELDLSPYIGGAKHALCYLQFSANIGGAAFGVKPAGVGRANYANTAETSGPSVARSELKDDKSFLIVETSSDGKIEWASSTGAYTVTIVLLGYIS